MMGYFEWCAILVSDCNALSQTSDGRKFLDALYRLYYHPLLSFRQKLANGATKLRFRLVPAF